jgi:hypothetical protein
MRFAVLPGGRRLKKNVYGILEPVRPEWVDSLDLVIVPGAAFTPRGIGWGRGRAITIGFWRGGRARRPWAFVLTGSGRFVCLVRNMIGGWIVL